ncbi:MAG: hypothetical protein RIR68_657, partial [Pseudomonadota bacterium]
SFGARLLYGPLTESSQLAQLTYLLALGKNTDSPPIL